MITKTKLTHVSWLTDICKYNIIMLWY